jgi:hypothetical protein
VAAVNPGDQITVTANSGGSVLASVIAIWSRDEIRLTVHQANSGSGPGAFTFQLGAREIFNAQPLATRVMLISTRAPLILYLFEAEGRWWDVMLEPAFIHAA